MVHTFHTRICNDISLLYENIIKILKGDDLFFCLTRMSYTYDKKYGYV